jgi:hypothetical protein
MLGKVKWQGTKTCNRCGVQNLRLHRKPNGDYILKEEGGEEVDWQWVPHRCDEDIVADRQFAKRIYLD